MPYEKLSIGGAHSDILSWARHDFSIEEQSMLRNVSRLPCLFKHVALMPDAHLGKGSMVGSVVATKDAVIPATVGVDIGCGMMAVKTPFKSGILDGKLKDLRLAIEETIPTGFSDYRVQQPARRCSRPQSESDEATRHARWRQSLHRSLSRY
jgi:tRNA-splicing ligase RtcB